MPPAYPIPFKIAPPLLFDMLARRRRSFRGDALAAVELLHPPLEIRSTELIPTAGPYLLTINHYDRPGFLAWWLILALSAALPVEVHWVMTATWVFPGRWFELPVSWLSTWLFREIARVYDFTNMTPIAPYSSQVEGRARSVRRVLDYARSTPQPVIGLAPEGKASDRGGLVQPPPGLGRFAARLGQLCQVILPAGIFEEADHLVVQFGAPYRLELPGGLSGEALDEHASRVVMDAIARLLPAHLRGGYG